MRGTVRSTWAYMPGIRAPPELGTCTSASSVRRGGVERVGGAGDRAGELAAGQFGDRERGVLAHPHGFGVGLRHVQVSAQAVGLGDAEQQGAALGDQRAGIDVAHRDHAGERRAHGLVALAARSGAPGWPRRRRRCCAPRPRPFRAPARWPAGRRTAPGRCRCPGARPRPSVEQVVPALGGDARQVFIGAALLQAGLGLLHGCCWPGRWRPGLVDLLIQFGRFDFRQHLARPSRGRRYPRSACGCSRWRAPAPGASVTAWILPGSTRLLLAPERVTGATLTTGRLSAAGLAIRRPAPASRRCRGR